MPIHPSIHALFIIRLSRPCLFPSLPKPTQPRVDKVETNLKTMALTLPIDLSASPLSAVPPDLTVCQPWFMRPAVLADCQAAFVNLPVNQDPVQYRPKRRDRREAMGLLAVETHG